MTNYFLILARNFSVNIYFHMCNYKNCYGNVSYISVPRWRPGLKMLQMKEVTALKDAAENLNTRMSTINWVRVFENPWCDENVLEKNPETVRPEQ